MASRYPSTPDYCDVCDANIRSVLGILEAKGPLEDSMRRELTRTMRSQCRNHTIYPLQTLSLNDPALDEDIQSSISRELGLPQDKECTASAPKFKQGSTTTCPHCERQGFPSKHVVFSVTEDNKVRYVEWHILYERDQEKS